MIEKGTDFRKSFDFIRSVRKAKLRELLTPYVKYSKEKNLEISVANYNIWLQNSVQNKTYSSVT